MELVGGILLAVGLSVVIMFFQSRKRKQAWSAQVIKIQNIAGHVDYAESEDDCCTNDTKACTRIYYRRDDGSKGKIRLETIHFQSMYPGLHVGSRLKKEAGKDSPEMISDDR